MTEPAFLDKSRQCKNPSFHAISREWSQNSPGFGGQKRSVAIDRERSMRANTRHVTALAHRKVMPNADARLRIEVSRVTFREPAPRCLVERSTFGGMLENPGEAAHPFRQVRAPLAHQHRRHG